MANDALSWTRKIAPKNAVFTNLHNDLDYHVLADELPERIEPAFDGMRLEVTEFSTENSRTVHAG